MPSRIGRRLLRCGAGGAVILCGTFAAVVATQWYWPTHDPSHGADTIVCLGSGVDDGIPTHDTIGRAERCTDLFLAGYADRIVFTGRDAAPLMADIALGAGIPNAAIMIEPDSRSTLQNALFTADLIQPDQSIILVTSAFHLPRSWLAFRTMGFRTQTLVASHHRTSDPRPFLREALAIWFNAGRTLMWWATPWLAEDTRAALLT